MIDALVELFLSLNQSCQRVEYHESWVYENRILCINGTITGGTLYAFEDAMIPRDIDVVILNSIGGTVYGGVEVSTLIKEKNINVIVPSWARCSSNCVLLLNAADNVIVEPGANINVHFVYLIKNGQFEVEFELSKQYFDAIGNKQLYKDYIEYILDNNIVTQQELDQQSVVRSIDSGWPQQSLMQINTNKLAYYGITK